LTNGLGASGTLNAGFGASATLGDYAVALSASQAADSAAATSASSDAKDTQSALSSTLQTETGVDMDSQLSLMIELQNAYGANAKIISTIQNMFTSLLQAV
jgi:flagellar hook-associated protein 1 FlgK